MNFLKHMYDKQPLILKYRYNIRFLKKKNTHVNNLLICRYKFIVIVGAVDMYVYHFT